MKPRKTKKAIKKFILMGAGDRLRPGDRVRVIRWINRQRAIDGRPPLPLRGRRIGLWELP